MNRNQDSSDAPGHSRRRVLGMLATGTAAVLLPWRARADFLQDTATPATNIADALKSPRTAGSLPGAFPGRVVKAFRENAVANNAPDITVLSDLVSHTLLSLTGESSTAKAWRKFVNPDDIVGIKVNPVAGPMLRTSPEIVHVIIRQLEDAGVRRGNIVIWDRREFELHEVGFTREAFPDIRIVGTERKDAGGSFTDPGGRLYSETMIDRDWYYWADVEGSYDAETLPYMINEGKYSYFSTICTNDVTKIINVPVLKNAGSSVTLCLKNLAYGSISNTGRLHKQLWHQTCAEVPAFLPLRDKVVLNIVDGIIGCYQGGPGADPRFITAFNTVLAGTDPVAVDRVGYDIVLRKRLQEGIQKEENPKAATFLQMAADLGLGTARLEEIDLLSV